MTAMWFLLFYVALPSALAWFGIHRTRGGRRAVGITALVAYVAVFMVAGPLLAAGGARATFQAPAVPQAR